MSDHDPVRDGRRGLRSSDPATGMVLVVLGHDHGDRPGLMLGDARLSLGAGNEDDVYLTGVGVVPGHLRLIFLEGSMTLLSATEEVRVDGLPIAAYPVDLQPLQVVSLGPDTHLAYGASDTEWPAAPTWQQPEATPSSDLGAQAGQGGSPATGTAGLAAATMTKRDRVLHGARWAALGLAAATFIVVGLVATDLAWGIRESVVPGEVAIERSEDALKRLLETDPEGYRSVSLTVRGDGALSLTGFIDSEDAYRRLAQQVRQQTVSSGGNVRMDVLTDGRLEGLIRDTLARFPLLGHLEVLPDVIRVTVSGLRLEKDIMNRIEADLLRLSARIQPRKLEVILALQDREKFMLEVSQALQSSPTTRELRFEVDERGGHIVGVVPAAFEAEALAAAMGVKRDFENQLPLRIDLRVDPKLNFKVVGLTQGGDGSTATLVQRGNAETFRIGDSVFGVAELKDIRLDGVTIAMGRRDVFLPLSR